MALDKDSITIVKDKAEKYFTKGDYKGALKTYEEIRSYGKSDPRIFIRIGDIARKLDDTPTAVAAYKDAVNAFTKLGFVVKAIAVGKIISQLDPSQQSKVEEALAEDYSSAASELPPPEPRGTPSVGSVPSASGAKPETKKREFPRVPLFSDFTKEELVEVVKLVKFHSHPAGEDVIKAGDDGASIFIIVSGSLAVIGKDVSGKEIQVVTLDKDSAFFGEFGFFSNARRKNAVRTLEETELLEVTKKDMDGVIAKWPRVEKVLFNFYKERVVENIMARSELFSSIVQGDRKDIIKDLTLKKFHNGELVCKQGDKGDEMYLLKSGHVSVWLPEGGGKKQLVELTEGEFIGEIALATSKPRVANVEAIGETEVVVFTRDVVRKILEKYPQVKSFLEGKIKARLTETMKAKAPADLV